MATECSSARAEHDQKPKRSRRRFIGLGAAAAAAAAGAAATGLGFSGRDAEAAPGDPLILGQSNNAGDQGTTLNASVSSVPVFQGAGLLVVNRPSPGDGQALNGLGGEAGVIGHIWGEAGTAGVLGLSFVHSGPLNLGTQVGVMGASGSGTGVVGLSANWAGEDPPSGPGVGVAGLSGSGLGVFGNSLALNGVQGVTNGEAPSACGVAGFSLKPGVDPTLRESYVPENYGACLGLLGWSGGGPGVFGGSVTSPGVFGTSYAEVAPGAGVHGVSFKPGVEPAYPDAFVPENFGSCPGVVGQSGSSAGTAGLSVTGPGAFGSSGSQNGVQGVTNGEAEPSAGVLGVSLKPGVDPTLPESYVPENFGSRPGVVGTSGSGPGVQAISVSGPALDVLGAARFATAGAGAVPAHRREAVIAKPAVTGQSHVTVTLADDPHGAAVEWVERQPGVGFVLHLTQKVKRDTGFTYLIVEPGA